MAAGSDIGDELAIHVIDERLEIGGFFRSHVVGGVARILELAGVNDDRFQLGPLHEVAVVGPLHDDPDGADDGSLVGVDLVAGGGDVVGPGGADGLDGGDDGFVGIVPDAEDFVVDFLRGGGVTAGRIDVEDDGFYVGVVGKFAELDVDFFGVEDDSVEIDDGDGIGREGAGSGVRAVQNGMDESPEEQGEDGDRAENDEGPEPAGAAHRKVCRGSISGSGISVGGRGLLRRRGRSLGVLVFLHGGSVAGRKIL